MRVLIVEDHAFNAFCLRRLMESMVPAVSVTIVNNSLAALSLINYDLPDLVVIDGDLGVAVDGLYCNGPALANTLLQKYPSLPLIVWSDSESMRKSFASVFKQHDRPMNEYNIWNKKISLERLNKTWAYYFSDLLNWHTDPGNSIFEPNVSWC